MEFNWYFIASRGLMILALILVMTTVYYTHESGENYAQNKCAKLGMELLDYQSSFFGHNVITCYDRDTKITKVVGGE